MTSLESATLRDCALGPGCRKASRGPVELEPEVSVSVEWRAAAARLGRVVTCRVTAARHGRPAGREPERRCRERPASPCEITLQIPRRWARARPVHLSATSGQRQWRRQLRAAAGVPSVARHACGPVPLLPGHRSLLTSPPPQPPPVPPHALFCRTGVKR